MIVSLAAYLQYAAGLRRRTLGVAQAIPNDRLDWAPAISQPQLTCGEIIRHIGSVQLMNTRAFLGQGFQYPGHANDLGAPLDYLNACQQHAEQLLAGLPDESLHTRQPDLNGRPTAAWRFLMAAAEHEIHHRSQLDVYLAFLDITPPQLYGVYMEDLPRN